jgi:hypothetical protein
MPLLYGKTSSAQPTRIADATAQGIRTSATGEQFVVPVGSGDYGLLMESSYFKAVNSTFNTAIAMSIAAATAFSEVQGSITIRNSNAVNGKDIFLDYIRVVIAAAGTGNTALSVAYQTDIITRYSSGGGALTPVNCNSGGSNTTGAVVHAGALTLVTSSALAKKLNGGAAVLKTTAPAANDIYFFSFANTDTTVTAPGAAVAIPCGPVLLPAGSNHTFVMHFFGAAQSAAPTAFFEIGYFER